MGRKNKKMRVTFFGLLALGVYSNIYSASVLSRLYARVLGNQDAKEEYQLLAYQALKDCGVANPQEVMVKQMNPVGSCIAGTPVSSFTAFGMWLDESCLDSCGDSEKMFQVYHEAVHYAQKHHQKLVATIGGISIAALASIMYVHKKVQSRALTASCTVIGLPILYGLLVPYLVKQQEKEADIKAARVLCELKQFDIVEARIALLQKYVQAHNNTQDNTVWWYSEQDQIGYLQKEIDCYKGSH